jgi:hypothetical protein
MTSHSDPVWIQSSWANGTLALGDDCRPAVSYNQQVQNIQNLGDLKAARDRLQSQLDGAAFNLKQCQQSSESLQQETKGFKRDLSALQQETEGNQD